MLTLKEMLHGKQANDFTPDVIDNAMELLEKVNKIRQAWNKPMTVTSGIRTLEDQKRINPSAMKSNHLTGHAIDIADEGLSFTAWLKGPGAKLLVECGLYCEDDNKNWAHLQDIPPRSGRRWFLP